MNKSFKEMGIISAIVADELMLDPKEMFAVSRKRELVYGRQVFHYVCKRYLRETLDVIGKFSKVMGRPEPHDHATVLYSYRSVKDLVSVDKAYRKKIERIEERVQSEMLFNKQRDFIVKSKETLVDDLFMEENGEFLIALKQLVLKLSKNKNMDEIQEMLKYQEDLENGRVRKIAQSYSSLGMV
jgi:hypothetical protein